MRQSQNFAPSNDPVPADFGSTVSTLTCRCRFIVFALLALVVGCSESRASQDNTARDAAVYRTVILDVIEQSGTELDGAGDPAVLYIEALGADGIPLEVQIEMVAGFLPQFEVRFIDNREEAIEIDLPRLPVRAESLLIGLGPVVVDEFADVRVEAYTSTAEIEGYGYTLVERGEGTWEVSGNPVSVEPEGLVTAP